MSKNTYLVVGSGGFIAGHLIKRLIDEGNTVIATDIKPKQFWFQTFDDVKSYADMDMKDYDNCLKVTKGVDYIFNMACNMGGMGFIENNKTL
jgi:nucleoside-diphosphate-sugar epimerase